MTERNWTAGPWFLHFDACGDAFISGSNADYVVTVGALDEDETAHADVHLISAAPELYEALEDVLGSALRYKLEPSDSCVDDALNAMAKARGDVTPEPTWRRTDED